MTKNTGRIIYCSIFNLFDRSIIFNISKCIVSIWYSSYTVWSRDDNILWQNDDRLFKWLVSDFFGKNHQNKFLNLN